MSQTLKLFLRSDPVRGDVMKRVLLALSVVPDLMVHYTTLGEPRRDGNGVVRNAILILHGTGGTGRQFLSKNFAEVLFGPGQLLDATTHYLILPDGIGHGQSSKPSDGLHAKFPRYA